MQYYTILYYTVLYCTVLYCTVLYCTVLYCNVLYCTVMYCTVLLEYFTYVQPILEYASTVWSPHIKADINKLEMIQRRAARFVLNNYSRFASVTRMLDALKMANT